MNPLPPAQPPKLLDRVRHACRVRHYSIRTEDAYHDWVERFVRFHGIRHPDTMREPEVNAFLTHLAVDRNVSASTQNQALCAHLFLYEHVLERPLGRIEGVIRANRPKRLPVVLTREEVRRLLAQLVDPYRLMGQWLSVPSPVVPSREGHFEGLWDKHLPELFRVPISWVVHTNTQRDSVHDTQANNQFGRRRELP